MNLATLSLGDYTSHQLRNLCKSCGTDDSVETLITLLRELLGPVGDRALSAPALWPSYVSDDMTPVEFSITFDENGNHMIRTLVEAIAEEPSNRSNARVALQTINSLADRYQLFLDRFHVVHDLFLPEQPQGQFALWCSLIARPNSRPGFKVYFNPDAQGPARAPQLVAEAFRRLGFDRAYEIATEHAVQRGGLDRFAYFAVDLDNDPRSRVKLYISHCGAETKDLERAASAAHGVDLTRIRDFCSLIGGGSGPFIGRPLLSAYTFVEGDFDRPSVYSLYLPIRDYVGDDEAARARVVTLMKQHSLNPAVLDYALTAISRRSLSDGVGLIPYVSMSLGKIRQGTTVYLSSEAYGVTPPRKVGVH
ncbi:MAG: tryptophan dimethylallyltransferase family protein [Pseudonocardiaceae bacterium]